MTSPKNRTIQHSFASTMHDARQELGATEAIFSRFIHAPIIAHLGTALAATLLRPRSLIIGSIFAAITVAAVYMLSHFYGYLSPGSEIAISFGIGWVIGLLYDGVLSLMHRFRR